MALPPQQFCVRWNSYHTNLQAVFPRLLLTEQFADVTLACESRQLRCHKLVLSACSAYLERLLLQNPCKHPIVLMRDMRFSEMQALVDFMYKGEVNVTQEELPSLLKSAEALQIRGLCSSDNGGFTQELDSSSSQQPARTRADSKDFAVASEQLVANATQGNTPKIANGTSQSQKQSGPASKKRKSDDGTTEVKEETVEEDGLYYGELDQDNIEYNEDEEPGKPGSSLGQSSDIAVDTDFAIANVQCQYDSSSDSEDTTVRPVGSVGRPPDDHTYDLRDEPPAFIIHQVSPQPSTVPSSPYIVAPKIMTLGPGFPPSVNVIRVGDPPKSTAPPPVRIAPRSPNESLKPSTSSELTMNKRIRRSEVLLKQAADWVSRGHTFQTVSAQFNIPISTIRFFMARKGILPQRKRGRSNRQSSPDLSGYQHFKLPKILPIPPIDDDEPNT